MKHKILTKAKEILVNEGYQQFNIRNIAKSCNISVGSIYNYFPDKNDILISMIEEFWSSVYDQLQVLSFTGDHFSKKFRKTYLLIHQNFSSYKSDILNLPHNISYLLKKKAKLLKLDYYSKFIDFLENLILAEVQMKDSRKMAEFLFDNILILLRKNVSTPDYLIEVAETLINNKKE